MKIIITESQYKKLFEAQMEGFDTKALNNMSFAARIRYCKQYLGLPIGNGSSRMVFQISDEKVLKLAKNNKGIAQNEREASILNDYIKSEMSIFPKVYEVGENNEWIIAEYVLPAKAQDFKVATGYDWTHVRAFIATVASQYSKIPSYLSDEEMEEMRDYDDEHSGFFHEIESYMSDYQITPIGDYLRLANWGMTLRDGEPYMVILDDGLSQDIYNKYYRR